MTQVLKICLFAMFSPETQLSSFSFLLLVLLVSYDLKGFCQEIDIIYPTDCVEG